MTAWRLVMGLLAVAAYLAMSHWLTLHAADRPWAIAACLAPWWIGAAVVALRQRAMLGMAALLLVALLVGLVVARGGLGDVRQLYLLQHAGIHLALGAMFANSLRSGHLSLIGGVASRVHGGLTPAMQAYCRAVTFSWVIYFVGMALLSVIVYRYFSWTSWSTLANIVTPLAIGAWFVGEFVLRYWLHPEFERATLMQAARAYSRAAPR